MKTCQFKMQCAVDAYKKGNFESTELHHDNFNRDFGTFCKATGVGKSRDIIKEIGLPRDFLEKDF